MALSTSQSWFQHWQPTGVVTNIDHNFGTVRTQHFITHPDTTHQEFGLPEIPSDGQYETFHKLNNTVVHRKQPGVKYGAKLSHKYRTPSRNAGELLTFSVLTCFCLSLSTSGVTPV